MAAQWAAADGAQVATIAAPAGVPARSPWVRGAFWDAFWMQSALWLAPLALWLASGHSDARASPLDGLYFGLTALFWIGHRLSSAYLAYGTEAYRPLLRTQRGRFIAVPALIALACFALFLPADATLPWTRQQRVILVAIVDYTFVTWHFAAQHFGALSIYRSRAGRSRCRWTRRIDRAFSVVVGGVLVLVADALAGAVAFQQHWIDLGYVPEWIVADPERIRLVATIVLLAVTSATLVLEMRAQQRSVPRLLYIAGLAIMVGIALTPRSLFLFLVIWTSQHWILAVGLASQTARAEPAPARGRIHGALHALNVRPWALVLFLAAVSIVLLPVFEVEASGDGDAFYGDRIFGALAASLRTSSWVPALVALGFASGFIHYFLDRSVFRFSNPGVRAAASGLLEPERHSRRDVGSTVLRRDAPNSSTRRRERG